jgi:Arc/MetJ-type ribon-helix-helix transcriptional regulator
MKSLHFKFPERLIERIEAQRKKDRLSPDRSEFIRRLLDMQLTRLEAADAREIARRQPQLLEHLLETNRSIPRPGDGSTEQSANSSTDAEEN